jgi:hypothetical protein
MNKLLATFAALMMSLPGAAMAQHMDINELISGIGGSDFLKAVERVDSSPAVRVVRLSTLAGADAAAARVADAVAGKPRDINYLHARLVINPIALSAIRNAGVELDQIVTLYVPGDGAAVLYADDLY